MFNTKLLNCEPVFISKVTHRLVQMKYKLIKELWILRD